jgi:hypothetical protein
MSHIGLRTSELVLRNWTRRRPTGTDASGAVEYSRNTGFWYAAFTSNARSWALERLSADKPVGSTKCESFMPSSRALRFIASTITCRPPGYAAPIA